MNIVQNDVTPWCSKQPCTWLTACPLRDLHPLCSADSPAERSCPIALPGPGPSEWGAGGAACHCLCQPGRSQSGLSDLVAFRAASARCLTVPVEDGDQQLVSRRTNRQNGSTRCARCLPSQRRRQPSRLHSQLLTFRYRWALSVCLAKRQSGRSSRVHHSELREIKRRFLEKKYQLWNDSKR